jgi:hypothetical protein
MLDGELSRWIPIRTVTRRPKPFKQVMHELYTLAAFYVLADQEGLMLPENSQGTREHMIAPWKYAGGLMKEGTPWPPSELLSLIRLAQHHGVPTRLLDWSYDINVATYFACVDAAKECKELEASAKAGELTNDRKRRYEDGRMEVWGLNLYFSTPDPEGGGSDAPFITVTAPGAENVNLRAQGGLFTVDNPAQFDWNDATDHVPMDEKLTRRPWTAPVMRRFQLSLREAPHLLTLLARERITGAKLFPGYDGVVRALRERKWRIRAGETRSS